MPQNMIFLSTSLRSTYMWNCDFTILHIGDVLMNMASLTYNILIKTCIHAGSIIQCKYMEQISNDSFIVVHVNDVMNLF
jgi:hypothetical protein